MAPKSATIAGLVTVPPPSEFHALQYPDPADLASRRHDSTGGRSLLPARRLAADAHQEPDCGGVLHHRRGDRLAGRLPRAAVEPDFVVRRVPGPGRRQADGDRGTAVAAGAGPGHRPDRAGHHRARNHDFGAARVDGADRRLQECRGEFPRQAQDHRADGCDSAAAVRRPPVRLRCPPARHLDDLRGGGADAVVDDLLHEAGVAADPRTQQRGGARRRAEMKKKFEKVVDGEGGSLHNLILVADDANESSEIRWVWRKML
ncbi:hypothetical protein CBM2623_A200020 [Cupriavidus taiwanensis]|nr:hypothetical protein CBM2608_A190019 [Cupriavidus taiwanensis]SPA27047.1 hypothetical protein CBM2623_A200020 [Cupriavidus taiwanensis]